VRGTSRGNIELASWASVALSVSSNLKLIGSGKVWLEGLDFDGLDFEGLWGSLAGLGLYFPAQRRASILIAQLTFFWPSR